MRRHLTSREQFLRVFSWFINNVDSFDFSTGYFLEFEDADKKRSKLQNAYLFGWVYTELSKSLNLAGYTVGGNAFTPAIIHAIAQANFRIIGQGQDDKGKDFYIYRSTADMGKKEFAEDIEKINFYFIDQYQIGIPDHRDNEYYDNIANEIGV